MDKIIHGDCLEELTKLDDNSVDLVCTDPPYGYSFMGKNWDKAVPSVEVWKECLRVLKPGGFAFVMSAPRQDVLSQMIVRIGDAGFDTDFTSIYWTYASGFPKAANIGKMVDKRNGTKRKLGKLKFKGGTQLGVINDDSWKPKDVYETSGTSPLEGSYGGFQPKPAVEVIIVAMKPLSEKTFVDQALKNGKGITWLDDCRIPTTSAEHEQMQENRKANRTIRAGEVAKGYGMKPQGLINSEQKQGRFTANLLVSDDVLNDGRIFKDGVSNNTKSAGLNFAGGKKPTRDHVMSYGSGGSYSRYFDLDAWAKTLPFLIVPKASKREKNEGLEGFEEKLMATDEVMKERLGKDWENINRPHIRNTKRANHHPTVKPLKLMSYLITLGSREGDVVLDPFAGSCTTAVACKNLNRSFICIEREAEYVGICEARVAAIPASLF
jgi:DNA modification methylase